MGICQGVGMGTTVLVRSRGGRALGATMVALAVLGLASAASGGVDDLARFSAPLVLFGLVGWAAFWRPYVEISDGGVHVTNTLRSVEVPWPALSEVDGRYGLTLRTAHGSVSAWAASAPAGRQRARREQSETSEQVRSRWEELRSAGYLEDPRLERPRLLVSWHRSLLSALAALVVLSVVLPLL